MRSNFGGRSLGGLLLILLGIIFLLKQLNLIQINIGQLFAVYWPVLLVLLGLKGMLERRSYHMGYRRRIFPSLLLIVIGLIFLNNNLGYFPVIHFSDVIKYVVPGGIILLGISMLTGSSYRENRKSRSSEKASYEQAYHHSEDLSQPKWFKETYSWKDKKEDNHSSFIGDIYVGQDYWELVPTNVSIFIGDTVLDLTKATIAYGQTTINISCFIGDVKVLVPNDIELDVSVAVSSVIGDVNVFDRHESGMFRTVSIQSDQYSLAEKRIHIQMSTFIGAVQVKKVG